VRSVWVGGINRWGDIAWDGDRLGESENDRVELFAMSRKKMRNKKLHRRNLTLQYGIQLLKKSFWVRIRKKKFLKE